MACNLNHNHFCRNILKLAGSDSTKYYITDEVRDFVVNLQLPDDLECEHCVFQVSERHVVCQDREQYSVDIFVDVFLFFIVETPFHKLIYIFRKNDCI